MVGIRGRCRRWSCITFSFDERRGQIRPGSTSRFTGFGPMTVDQANGIYAVAVVDSPIRENGVVESIVADQRASSPNLDQVPSTLFVKCETHHCRHTIRPLSYHTIPANASIPSTSNPPTISSETDQSMQISRPKEQIYRRSVGQARELRYTRYRHCIIVKVDNGLLASRNFNQVTAKHQHMRRLIRDLKLSRPTLSAEQRHKSQPEPRLVFKRTNGCAL